MEEEKKGRKEEAVKEYKTIGKRGRVGQSDAVTTTRAALRQWLSDGCETRMVVYAGASRRSAKNYFGLVCGHLDKLSLASEIASPHDEKLAALAPLVSRDVERLTMRMSGKSGSLVIHHGSENSSNNNKTSDKDEES